MPLVIRADFDEWMTELDEEGKRFRKEGPPEVDFGCWWELYPSDKMLEVVAITVGSTPDRMLSVADTHWRVSWIPATGELYAKQLSTRLKHFFLIGVYTEEQVKARMEGWAEEEGRALTEWFRWELTAKRPAEDVLELYGREPPKP